MTLPERPTAGPAPTTALSPAITGHGSGGDLSTLSPADRDRAVSILLAASAPSTRRAYKADWERFSAWCDRNNRSALPADIDGVVLYFNEHATALTEDGTRAFALSTLRRWKSTINKVHQSNGFSKPGDHPIVKESFQAYARLYATVLPRPPRKRAALLLDPLRDIVATARTDARSWQTRVRERRDTAILVIGWAGGLRREEVTAITPHCFIPGDSLTGNTSDPSTTGYTLDIIRSKTDQTGEGMVKALPVGQELTSCGPCAMIRWLEVLAAWERDGRIGLMRDFTAPAVVDHTEHVCGHDRFAELMEQVQTRAPFIRAISRNGLLGASAPDPVIVHTTIRRRAAAAGWSDEAIEALGGHSLRAGFVTEGMRQGASVHAIRRQTGHTSDATVYGYARHTTVWESNAVTDLGM